MIKKNSKLKSLDFKDFNQKNLKTINSQYFRSFYVQKDSLRLAVIISKKVYKKAVDRNKAKRRVYSAIRDIDIKKPGFYKVVITQKINLVNFVEIKKDLQKIFYV